MNAEEQAQALARWLDDDGGTPPHGLDPDVLEAVWALRPSMAPAPRVDLADLLGSIEAGPLAVPPSEAQQALALWLEDTTQPPPQTTDPAILEAIYVLRPELAPAPRVSADDLLDALPATVDATVGEDEMAEAAALKAFLDDGAPLPVDAADTLFALRPDLAPAPRVTTDDLLEGLTEGPFAAVAPPIPSSLGVAPEIPVAANRRRRWWMGAGTLVAAATALFIALPTITMNRDASPAMEPTTEEPIASPPSEAPTVATTDSEIATPVQAKTRSEVATVEKKDAIDVGSRTRSSAGPSLGQARSGSATRSVASKPVAPPAAAAAPAPAPSPGAMDRSLAAGSGLADFDGLDDAVADLGDLDAADEMEEEAEIAELDDIGFAADDWTAGGLDEDAYPSRTDGAAGAAAGLAADTGGPARYAVEEVAATESTKQKRLARPAKKASEQRAPPPPPSPATIPEIAQASSPPHGAPPVDGLDPSTRLAVLDAWSRATGFASVGQYQSAADALRPAITSPQSVGQYSAARAARYLLSAGDPSGAVAIAEQGLALGTATTSYRTDLLVVYAEALDAVGDPKRAAAARDAAH